MSRNGDGITMSPDQANEQTAEPPSSGSWPVLRG